MAEGQDLMAQFEAVQQALQQVDGQLGRIEEQALDLRRAIATLEALQETTGDQETLVPIGGGVHVRARITSERAVVNPIGRGYAADMDLDGAKAALEARAQEAEGLLTQKTQEAQRLASMAQRLAQQLQSAPA